MNNSSGIEGKIEILTIILIFVIFVIFALAGFLIYLYFK